MSEVEEHLASARAALAEEDLHGTLAWIEMYLHALDAQPPAVASAALRL
jgi:hypothetical protein